MKKRVIIAIILVVLLLPAAVFFTTLKIAFGRDYEKDVLITSPDGKYTLIVREWGTFGGTGAEIYGVAGSSPNALEIRLAEKLGNTIADDVCYPFNSGTYVVEWNEDSILIRYFSGRQIQTSDPETWDTVTLRYPDNTTVYIKLASIIVLAVLILAAATAVIVKAVRTRRSRPEKTEEAVMADVEGPAKSTLYTVISTVLLVLLVLSLINCFIIGVKAFSAGMRDEEALPFVALLLTVVIVLLNYAALPIALADMRYCVKYFFSDKRTKLKTVLNAVFTAYDTVMITVFLLTLSDSVKFFVSFKLTLGYLLYRVLYLVVLRITGRVTPPDPE